VFCFTCFVSRLKLTIQRSPRTLDELQGPTSKVGEGNKRVEGVKGERKGRQGGKKREEGEGKV